MERIALGIEYDGGKFHGWQKQGALPTLQYALEQALSRVADIPVATICAGRTDAGVHAIGQVVHFDSQVSRSMDAWIRGTNTYLPHAIQVQWAKKVPMDFHARFSALARTYQYIVYAHPRRPAVFRQYMAYYDNVFHVQRMQEAASVLIGEHDFSSFRSGECGAKSPIRTLHTLHIEQRSHLLIFTLKANAFLHHMVRKIVTVLLEIGLHKQPVTWAHDILRARDHLSVRQLVPPQGLYFRQVDYAQHFDLPRHRSVMLHILSERDNHELV